MKTVKELVNSFLIGGMFAVIGELIFKLLLSVLGPEFPLLGPMTLAGLALICGILWICGILQKIEKIGEYGAILHLGSCASAVANIFQEGKRAGKTTGEALKDATSPVTFVCGIGTLAAGVVGIIMAIAE